MAEPLLQVSNLNKSFGAVAASRDLSFDLLAPPPRFNIVFLLQNPFFYV